MSCHEGGAFVLSFGQVQPSPTPQHTRGWIRIKQEARASSVFGDDALFKARELPAVRRLEDVRTDLLAQMFSKDKKKK